MIEQVKYSPDPGLPFLRRRMPRGRRLQVLLLVRGLLFALLVGVSLFPLSSNPARAGTLVNHLEFGLSQCPSDAPQDTGLSDRLLRWDTGGYSDYSVYSSAFEQWTISTVTPTADDRYAAVWPGFTDNRSGTIVQAGFATNSVGGKAQYYAWWETFPNPPHILDTTIYPVLPGDNVSVRITRTDQTDQNWQITLDDTTLWGSALHVSVVGFYDPGEPQYAYETQPGTYGTTNQFSPHTSPIQIWGTGYTVFGNSSDQYNHWNTGDCIRDNQNVVLVYTSVPDNAGGFTITTDPPTPAYPVEDYGPGNNSSCCFSFSTSGGGTWFQDFDGGGEEGQAIYTNPSGTNQTTASADWHPPLSPYQWYTVVVYIPFNALGPLGSAHYYVDNQYYAHQQLTLNQASYKGQWVTLGTFQADSNGSMHVALQNDTSQATYYTLIADGMSFIPTSVSPPFPVLDVPGGGAFYSIWELTGGAVGPLGEPTNRWFSINGGQEQDFQHGSIYWSAATGTEEVQGDIYGEYANVWGGPGGGLGFPTTDEEGMAGGRVSYFAGNLCESRGPNNSGAAIYYSSATGAHQVGGCIYQKYWQMGEANSQLSFPTSDVLAISNGYVSYFYGVRCGGVATGPDNSGSAIYASVAGDFYVQGCVYAKYQQLGATTSQLGFPVSDENTLHNSSGSTIGWVSYFAGVKCGNGGPSGSGSAIYVPASNNAASGGHEVQGCVFAAYQRLGGPLGVLGFPVSDEHTLHNSSGSTIGWDSSFQGTSCGTGGGGGGIFVPASNNTASGGFEVHGCIYQEYMAVQGGPTGVLGFPTTDQQSIAGGDVSYFSGNLCGAPGPNNSGSAIYNNGGSSTHQVGGCIYNKYWPMGGPTSFLGFPVSDVTAISGGYVSYFAGQSCNGGGPNGSGSAIYSSSPGTFEVHGCIYHEYASVMGGPSGALGFPTSDEHAITSGYSDLPARISTFQQGSIYYYNGNAYEVQGDIYSAYLNTGGAGGGLGLPTSSEYTNGLGNRESDFENGLIQYNPSTHQTTVVINPPCC